MGELKADFDAIKAAAARIEAHADQYRASSEAAKAQRAGENGTWGGDEPGVKFAGGPEGYVAAARAGDENAKALAEVGRDFGEQLGQAARDLQAQEGVNRDNLSDQA